MMKRLTENLVEFGDHDENTIKQIENCMSVGDVKAGVLCADGHLGYSQPIGGVIAYRNMISPSGVGYDISCGNKAVRTNMTADQLSQEDIVRIANDIESQISFGIGRKNQEEVDHALFDSDTWNDISELKPLKDMARAQLGTVGSGNHYVDVLVEPVTNAIWVACHFGSRGFGHKTASGFLNMADGFGFNDKPRGESMMQDPTLLSLDTDLGQSYIKAMELAGEYAYAGRDWVCDKVLSILGAEKNFEVHNHHNFAWKEVHDGEEVYVVRKGATPCFPDQYGFVGGSMADISVVIKGVESEESKQALYSTIHGAGRLMSRNQARGKWNKKEKAYIGGCITPEQMQNALSEYGVTVKGGGCDESPFVYRNLQDVLNAHSNTLDVVHVMKPLIVVMASEKTIDPYKD